MYHCGGDDDGDGGGEEVFALHAFHLFEPCALTRSLATFRFFMNPISQQYNRQYYTWYGLVYVLFFLHFFQLLSDAFLSLSFNFLLLSNIKKMDMDVTRECVTMWHA